MAAAGRGVNYLGAVVNWRVLVMSTGCVKYLMFL